MTVLNLYLFFRLTLLPLQQSMAMSLACEPLSFIQLVDLRDILATHPILFSFPEVTFKETTVRPYNDAEATLSV